MKIIYWSDAALPSRAANTVHVMKMGQALADNFNNVDVIAHRKDNKTDEKKYLNTMVSAAILLLS